VRNKDSRLWSVDTATEFLISKITKQSEMDGVSLSTVERRMIAFSPERPPSSELMDEFDTDYDRSEYDAKVVQLVKAAYKSDQRLSPLDLPNWWTAIHTLECEDEENWILGQIREAGLRPLGDVWRLLGAEAVCAAIFVAFAALGIHFNAPEWFGLAWSFAFVIAIFALWSYLWRASSKKARLFGDLIILLFVLLPRAIFQIAVFGARAIGRKLNRNRQNLTGSR
jgi:hypothetical protein